MSMMSRGGSSIGPGSLASSPFEPATDHGEEEPGRQPQPEDRPDDHQQNWLTQADRDEGVRPGSTSDDQAENRELRRHVRLLEQENEVLRRAAAYLPRRSCRGDDVPARPRPCR